MKQKTVSVFLREQYHEKILKLSLTAGCTCPTRDGTKGYMGCSFCSGGGSGEFAAPFLPVREQIRLAKLLVDPKFPRSQPEETRRYIAYFQPFSNTYGDVDRLKRLYEETIALPEIVILSLATRPDCLPEEMVSLLGELNRRKPVWVELGLQTVHERTAEAFGRGDPLAVFEDAYRRLKAAGITVIVHTILGLPGESREDMRETMRYLAGLSPVLDGIKIQVLQILKGTRMGEEWQREPFPLLSLEEYAELTAECLEILPAETVVHRMTGDPPKKLLIAPAWCADKKRVWNTLQQTITSASVRGKGGQEWRFVQQQ